MRESAVRYAGRIAFDDISPILAELDAGKKDSRLLAAEALFRMHVDRITPHLDTLRAHLDAEKDIAVQGALEAVIARITAA